MVGSINYSADLGAQESILVLLNSPMTFDWSNGAVEYSIEIPAGFSYELSKAPAWLLALVPDTLSSPHILWALYFWLKENQGKLVFGPYTERKPMYDWRKEYRRFTGADVVELMLIVFGQNNIQLSWFGKLLLRFKL